MVKSKMMHEPGGTGLYFTMDTITWEQHIFWTDALEPGFVTASSFFFPFTLKRKTQDKHSMFPSFLLELSKKRKP